MREREQPNRRVEIIGFMVGLLVILGVASFSFWRPWERNVWALVIWVVLKLLAIVAFIGFLAAVREVVVILRSRKPRRKETR